jgi:hypothetical protein
MEVTASGTPLGAIQATGGPGGKVLEVVGVGEVVVVGRLVEVAGEVEVVAPPDSGGGPVHATANRQHNRTWTGSRIGLHLGTRW